MQSVVLARPQQAELCRSVAQMNRKRDPRAPKEATIEQRRSASSNGELVELRRKRRRLRAEMVMAYGSVKNTPADSEARRKHTELSQEITRVRQVVDREAISQAKEDYFTTMPVAEINKQIDLLLGCDSGETSQNAGEDEWQPAKPEFSTVEQARIADAFFGPEAETLTGEEALARRIQVIEDLVGLCPLEEPSLRAKKRKWSEVEDDSDADSDANSDASLKQEEENTLSPQHDSFEFTTDQCIFCAANVGARTFYPRKKQRPDSLRRHLENQHLNRFAEGEVVQCPREICGGQKFESVYIWLNHAARVHKYDLHVKLHRSA